MGGLNLGWVYLFMGIVIGSSVIPLWNMMTWNKASGKGAVVSAWTAFFMAVIVWLIYGYVKGGELTVASLGQNEVMLTGNLTAILGSGIIHYVYSKKHPQNYDFSELDKSINLVENDTSGLTDAEKDPEKLKKITKWIVIRGWFLAIFLILVWPLISIPAGVFTQTYFAFWVMVAVIWGFGAAVIIIALPLLESRDEIGEAYTVMKSKSFKAKSDIAKEVDVAEAVDDEEAAVNEKKFERGMTLSDSDSAENMSEPEELK